MASERTPPKDERTRDDKAERETKLAEALRANLRRRKAGTGQGAARKPQDGESA